jgi:hypothetical protein
LSFFPITGLFFFREQNQEYFLITERKAFSILAASAGSAGHRLA